MNIVYCDCFSGISGDMFLGALIDAGLPVETLAEPFKRLDLPEFEGVSAARVKKGALAATLLDLHIHEHAHEHEAGHEHAHHRHLSDITTLIDSSSLSPYVKETSLKVFHKLAEAEAAVHGSTIEEVHFHEVGAVDSILDIVGAAVGLEYFAIEGFFASALPLGSGQVKTQHGILPLPAPATTELLRLANAPVVPSKATAELVTPTGAAILAALAEFRQPAMTLQRVGTGAGRREMEWPNVLRVLIGSQESGAETHLEIETNIDDMNPQLYGPVMSRLFEAGALDVYLTPIYMKKNRPATKLSVIARKQDELALCDILLRQTSTLGLRVHPVWRHEAQREMRQVVTRFGEAPVKVKIVGGRAVQATPEFEACVRLAEAASVPVAEVVQAAAAASLDLITRSQ
jgi:pyridinium-3,5-bisthiocarboxylic acid mononucleotide nickel chelatase